jgi:hypothetical protein
LELWLKGILLKTSTFFFLHFWLVFLCMLDSGFVALETKKVLSI